MHASGVRGAALCVGNLGIEAGLPRHRELVQPLQCMQLERAVQPCVLEASFPPAATWQDFKLSKIYSITCVSYHVFLCSPRIQLHPWDPVLVEVGENDHVKSGCLDTILIK